MLQAVAMNARRAGNHSFEPAFVERAFVEPYAAGPPAEAAPRVADMFGDMAEVQPQRLLEDAEEGIAYTPGFVAPDVAARWFAALRDGIAWQSQRRPMYDRVVDVPRLTATWWLDDPALPGALAEAAALLQPALGHPFNAVGLNFYRDGRDSVALHNDKLHSLVPGHPIALVSLGARRRMTIRAKPPARQVQRIDLAPGSLMVMSHASQHTHEHGIAKTTAPVGVRISLAFRVRPSTRAGGM
jgi:alkylated DNA repair dioxygenase AlkB